jgi:hypothetical protein
MTQEQALLREIVELERGEVVGHEYRTAFKALMRRAAAVVDNPEPELLIIIHGGDTLADGRMNATFVWPPEWPLTIPTQYWLRAANGEQTT